MRAIGIILAGGLEDYPDGVLAGGQVIRAKDGEQA